MKKSNNIKSVRERLGLSQSALAAEIGVSQGKYQPLRVPAPKRSTGCI
ncbi:helix-turn-helix transcriptional regulator [Pectobacterium versatile]